MPQLQARSKEVAHRVSTMGSRFGAFGRSVVASTSEVFDQVGTLLSLTPQLCCRHWAQQQSIWGNDLAGVLAVTGSSADACSLSEQLLQAAACLLLSSFLVRCPELCGG